jgi:UDP-glucose:(heptosyl)LPS alpha-1,3-glucosyltransferase
MGLRIAVLSRNFVASGGGAERYSIAVVEHLASRHEIHVFAQNITHQFPGVTYHRISSPLKASRWMNQIYFATATWWATRRGFDVVHSHENTWHGNVQTVHVLPIRHNLFKDLTGMSRAMRWINIATSPRLIAYLLMEKMRYSLRKPRSITLASRSLDRVMRQTYVDSLSALRVITPGVDVVEGPASPEIKNVARSRLGLPQSGRCILFVGNDVRKKGLPALLAAMPHLPSDMYVAVVSNTSQFESMRILADELGVANRVYLLGKLGDVRDAYRSADVLVHPTLEDTYAMVVLEAMSHGLPVVVSGPVFCGIAEDLQNGIEAIFLTDPRNPQEIASTIISVLDDPSNASRLVANGVKFANDHLWVTSALQYEKVYAELAEA